jgi:hypothetical protein
MDDFSTYAEEMRRQAQATLSAREPELARAVYEQVLERALAEQGFEPLRALAARIASGVIARFLEAGKHAEADHVWKSVERLAGDSAAPDTRGALGLCASNALMGRLLKGETARARDAFAVLARIAERKPRIDELDTLLTEAALRLVVVWLQVRSPSEAYDFYILLRRAAERHTGDPAMRRSRAKACLLLAVAFSHGGDPNFARSLASEAAGLVAEAPDDPELDQVRERLDRAFPSRG